MSRYFKEYSKQQGKFTMCLYLIVKLIIYLISHYTVSVFFLQIASLSCLMHLSFFNFDFILWRLCTVV